MKITEDGHVVWNDLCFDKSLKYQELSFKGMVLEKSLFRRGRFV